MRIRGISGQPGGGIVRCSRAAQRRLRPGAVPVETASIRGSPPCGGDPGVAAAGALARLAACERPA